EHAAAFTAESGDQDRDGTLGQHAHLLSSFGWSQPMTVLRNRAANRSRKFGFCTISARKNEGQRIAAWATSPHSPQPTQSLFTCATGSTLSGSLAALTVSEGQTERRMEEWSTEHTSSSTTKSVRTKRLIALRAAAIGGG